MEASSPLCRTSAVYDRRVRVLVTGGAGFIGSHLVDALVEPWRRGDGRRRPLDRAPGIRQRGGPACSNTTSASPFETDADIVFHLAAQADVGTSVERPAFDAEVNVVGTVNVLEAARGAGAAVVFSSTGGAIYGDVDAPAAEDAPLRPVSPYGIAKLGGEAYVDGWRRIHGLAYGRTQIRERVRAATVGVSRRRRDRDLPRADGVRRGDVVFGDGEQTRDFVHVDDVVRALLPPRAANGGVFNVGTGVETSVERLHELCRTSSATRGAAARGAAGGDARRSVLDVSRAASELGWQPESSSRKGLRSRGRDPGGMSRPQANRSLAVDHPLPPPKRSSIPGASRRSSRPPWPGSSSCCSSSSAAR